METPTVSSSLKKLAGSGRAESHSTLEKKFDQTAQAGKKVGTMMKSMM